MTQFGPPPQVPLLGQQKKLQDRAIQAAVNSLSLQIYSHLATGYIASRDEHEQMDPDFLRQLAKHSATAALCYFEGLTEKKGETE